MEHDDEQIGHVLSRREVIALLGAIGVSAVGATGTTALGAGRAHSRGGTGAASRPGPSGATRPDELRSLPPCVVRPEQTEGPYFIDEVLRRADIRSDPADGSVSDGAPLEVALRVSRIDADGCRPLPGALVDLWQCDALGVYSGVRDINGQFDTSGKKFLRGHLLSDEEGVVRFTTIYPGWYQGRTVHLHFKIRTDPESERGHEFTSQLYFDDAVTDRVLAREPYAGVEGERVRNERDGIFREGGDRLMLDVVENGAGYAGEFDIGLQLT